MKSNRRKEKKIKEMMKTEKERKGRRKEVHKKSDKVWKRRIQETKRGDGEQ